MKSNTYPVKIITIMLQHDQQAYYTTCNHILLSIVLLIPFTLWLPKTFITYSWLRVLILLPISETYFYWAHRLAHISYFYIYHKKHHEYTLPPWWAAYHCSLVEHLCVNLGSVFVPLLLVECSIGQAWIFILIVTINSIWAHDSQPRNTHVKHHLNQKCNFGAGLYLWDRIFATYSA